MTDAFKKSGPFFRSLLLPSGICSGVFARAYASLFIDNIHLISLQPSLIYVNDPSLPLGLKGLYSAGAQFPPLPRQAHVLPE
jgi:hypothetical protein